MKIVVLKCDLDLNDAKSKQRAIQAVSGLSGDVTISTDANQKTVTVTGSVDPIDLLSKLSKICRAELVSVKPETAQENKKSPIENIVDLYKAYNPVDMVWKVGDICHSVLFPQRKAKYPIHNAQNRPANMSANEFFTPDWHNHNNHF